MSKIGPGISVTHVDIVFAWIASAVILDQVMAIIWEVANVASVNQDGYICSMEFDRKL